MPPIIQPDPANPNSPAIGSVLWLNSDDASPREWEFAVIVIAADTFRSLEARWRIVKQDDPDPAFATLLLEAGKRIRPVKIKVTSSQLKYNECHRLQLVVSGSFLKVPKVDPRYLFDALDPRPGEERAERGEDRADANWWLWEGKSNVQGTPDDAAHILATCGAPDTAPTNNPAMPGGVVP